MTMMIKSRLVNNLLFNFIQLETFLLCSHLFFTLLCFLDFKIEYQGTDDSHIQNTNNNNNNNNRNHDD